MKIIYFSPHPHINMAAPSGPGTHIREVIKGFEARGYQVIRFIAGGEELKSGHSIQFKKRNWKKFIPKYVWESLRDYSLKKTDKILQQQLEELIRKEKPDVIYERAYYLMSAGYKAAQKTGVKYCCEINAPYPEEKSEMNGKSIFHSAAESNERNQVHASHRVIVVSTALKNYLEKKTDTSSDKIIVTPNAVNPDYIHNDERVSKKIRTDLNAGETDIVIGFVGSIFPYHGVDLLIESFADLVRSGTVQIRLLIVGDGEILSQLKSRCDELNISHLTRFTGNIPHQEVYNYIASMDITVMARSNWYGSPVKIFEYGIMKKGIIAPDVVPVHDVMANGVDGIFVRDDRQTLTTALRTMITDTNLRESMAQHFYEKVKSQHTWQVVSDRILEAMR